MNTSRKGISLVEVVFGIAIAAGIFFVIASLSGNLNTLQNFLNQKLQSRQDIDQAFQIMTTEIRSASRSNAGAYPIDSATTSSFEFYSDIDRDGLVEHVRYFLGTSTVQKGVIKPTGNPWTYPTSSEVLSTAVQNVVSGTSTPLFSYFDSNYTGAEPAMAYPIDIPSVRIVKFALYADVNASTTPKPEYFSGVVLIRNVKSN